MLDAANELSDSELRVLGRAQAREVEQRLSLFFLIRSRFHRRLLI